MIDQGTRSKEWNRVFFKPNFKTMQPFIQVNYGKATQHNMLDWSYNGQSCQVQFSNNFRDNKRHPRIHSRKAKDNSTISTVLGSSPATTVRGSMWSMTASSLQRKSSGTNKKAQTWPSITSIKSEMLCGGITLPSTRCHLPECQQ